MNKKKEIINLHRALETSEEIQEYLNNSHKGFTLLSERMNRNDILKLKCPKGHLIELKLSHFKARKNKCATCFKEDAYNEHISKFESLAIDSEYKIRSYTDKYRATVQCNKGHDEYSVKTGNFINGTRCKKCSSEKLSLDRKHSYEYIKNYIEVESNSGYEMLGKDYINNRTHFQIMCDKGHIYETLFNNFIRGYRCMTCHNLSTRGENSHLWKGGVTELPKTLRRSTHEWKRRSIEATGGRCDVTGEIGELEVHHIYPFHKIVRDVLECLDLPYKDNIISYTDRERDAISYEIEERHSNMLGAPLLKDAHTLFHMTFGFHDNTSEQYEY